MTPYQRWRMCDRKIAYRTQARANRVASRCAKRYQTKGLHVYRCTVRGQWHLTHAPRHRAEST